MNFLQQLNSCRNIDEITRLIVPENHDVILENLHVVIDTAGNTNIPSILQCFIKNHILADVEIKDVMFQIINHIEGNLGMIKRLLALCSNYIDYSKEDLKHLFSSIIIEKNPNVDKALLKKKINKLVNSQFLDEMRFAGFGAYSIVFKNGKTIVKISFDGEEYISYNSEQILRFDSIENTDIDGIRISTATQKAANVDWYRKLSEEEMNLKMYAVFCSAVSDGYLIYDINKANFGEIDGNLMLIDSGAVYKGRNINQAYLETHLKKFKHFIKLYNAGYRIKDDGQIYVKGKSVNPKLIFDDSLSAEEIKLIASNVSTRACDLAYYYLNNRIAGRDNLKYE